VAPGHEKDYSKVIVLTVDITQRKQAEKAAQQYASDLERRVEERTIELTHANRAKNEFLANMSHELRTPLNSILGLSESLLEQSRGPLNEKQEHALQIIASSGKHLLGLINDILEVSKIEAGKMEIHPDIISVKDICYSSLNFVKEAGLKKSIAIDLQSDPSVSTLFADPQRLKQILVNLLSNAVKFTPERGKVILAVNTNTDQDQIQFSVTDNGIGIAPENLKKLFSPFMQVDSSLARQYQGTGLGLTIAYKLTELHGGSMQVESEIGKGSCFTISLPWDPTKTIKSNSSPAEKHEITTQAPKPALRPHVKVLLADDHDTNTMMLGEYLQSHGYEVTIARNGLEALAKAADTQPHIIIMDIQMPEMDGLEAIQHLRLDERFVSTPIIALTALAMSGDRERCLEAGANEYMSKPVSLKALAETIQKLVQPGE
jgi:signal transduction histidine kinase/CheY-like chemotaxis protein